VVLILATTNFWVGLYATLAILGIVAWVLGLEVALGFEFGTAESVSAVILIGFSVDYSVHLAVHYVTSPSGTQKERVRDSMTEMGVSILAGAVTTSGGGSFLFGGTIIFFTKFAILICASLVFSLLFSLALLPALLMVAGPAGEEGSIYHITHLCKPKPKTETGVSATAESNHVAQVV
jgi:predicted RND superfamily exporter protein